MIRDHETLENKMYQMALALLNEGHGHDGTIMKFITELNRAEAYLERRAQWRQREG